MQLLAADTDSASAAVQVELLRHASIAQRLALAFAVSETVLTLARQAVRQGRAGMSASELGVRFVATQYGTALAEDLRRELARRQRDRT